MRPSGSLYDPFLTKLYQLQIIHNCSLVQFVLFSVSFLYLEANSMRTRYARVEKDAFALFYDTLSTSRFRPTPKHDAKIILVRRASLKNEPTVLRCFTHCLNRGNLIRSTRVIRYTREIGERATETAQLTLSLIIHRYAFNRARPRHSQRTKDPLTREAQPHSFEPRRPPKYHGEIHIHTLLDEKIAHVRSR